MITRDIRRLFGTADRYVDSGHTLRRRLRLISKAERREEARAFINMFCDETGQIDSYRTQRIANVRREISRFNYYEHSPEELAFGARVAWRNHARCIGRLFWESLEVADCRHITEPAMIAARMQDHLREAYSDGRIKSMISIFAPVQDDRLPSTIESTQITQYAGYISDDGAVTGDRQNVEATRIAQSMGWRSPSVPGRFDRLPVTIRDADDRRSIHALDDSVWHEVEMSHPEHESLVDLGLRWYAVPVVSNMILSIGGIDYPCAPFNGFYMGTEIASRNFADKKRYDVLSVVADALQIDSNSKRNPLWRDTTLTELNRSVLHSFQQAGVTLIDHHSASEQFMEFYRREQVCGRHVAADWRWIVPPQSSGITDVFHLKMRNYHPLPNYYDSRSTDAYRLMPYYGDAEQTRLQRNYHRIKRRLRLWKREPW